MYADADSLLMTTPVKLFNLNLIMYLNCIYNMTVTGSYLTVLTIVSYGHVLEMFVVKHLHV